MSPTQRSLAHLRERGFEAKVVEKWNPFAGIRQDLWGWMDIIAYHPGERVTLGVQTTSRPHLAERKNKIAGNPYAATWLAAGNKIEVHAWACKRPRGGKRVFYELMREEIVL